MAPRVGGILWRHYLLSCNVRLGTFHFQLEFIQRMSSQLRHFTAGAARFLIVLLASATLLRADASEEPPPNIVIILVDDMGYGDPQCFNPQSKIKTPNIDGLARDGMRFTDAHAPGPLCHMSRYGLMTGRYPFRTNVGVWAKQPVIQSDEMTIASLLKDAGYHTAMVGKWHLGFDESAGYGSLLPGGPVDRGFQTFFGIRASTDIPPYFYIRDRRAVAPPTGRITANNTEGWSKIQGEFWRAGGIAPDLALKDVLPRFTQEAIQVIESHAAANTSKASKQQPLMLYLAYPAPHTPWLPSAEFQGKSGAGMYGDFVMMVDQMIGRVTKTLAKAGMDENTLLIFSSDNGPVWYEKDVERFGHDASGGLRGMKADAWECGHRMPFIVRWPQTVKAGARSEQMICFTDFMATFAELVGRELPYAAGPDSVSFLSALTGDDSAPIRQHLVIRSGGPLMSIRSGHWKLINGLGSSGFSSPKRVVRGKNDPQGQLYDLSQDLGETNNVYQDHPEVVARMTKKLKQVIADGRSR